MKVRTRKYSVTTISQMDSLINANVLKFSLICYLHLQCIPIIRCKTVTNLDNFIALNLECFPLRENVTHNEEFQSENSHCLSLTVCNNFFSVTCTRVGLTSQ